MGEGGCEDLPVYQYNNVAIKVEFYLVPQHPIYQFSSILGSLEGRTGESIVEVEEEGTYPNIEFNIFIRYCFDVEADGGDCSYRLIKFEFIQYRWESGLSLIFVEDEEKREERTASEG